MRWSTVCGEMWSSAGDFLGRQMLVDEQEAVELTRRQARDALGDLTIFCGSVRIVGESGTPAVSFNAIGPLNMAVLPEQRVREPPYCKSRHLTSFLQFFGNFRCPL